MLGVNPFDLKAALLAKHGQHVVLIHFPIAMYLGGTVFDFCARMSRKPVLAEVARRGGDLHSRRSNWTPRLAVGAGGKTPERHAAAAPVIRLRDSDRALADGLTVSKAAVDAGRGDSFLAAAYRDGGMRPGGADRASGRIFERGEYGIVKKVETGSLYRA